MRSRPLLDPLPLLSSITYIHMYILMLLCFWGQGGSWQSRFSAAEDGIYIRGRHGVFKGFPKARFQIARSSKIKRILSDFGLVFPPQNPVTRLQNSTIDNSLSPSRRRGRVMRLHPLQPQPEPEQAITSSRSFAKSDGHLHFALHPVSTMGMSTLGSKEGISPLKTCSLGDADIALPLPSGYRLAPHSSREGLWAVRGRRTKE